YALIGGQSQGLLFIVPMALSVIATSVVALITWRRNQQLDRQRRENYAKRLADLRDQMYKFHEQQRQFYLDNFPGTDTLYAYAADKSAELWDRRPDEEYFGAVRLGLGQTRSGMVFRPPSSDDSGAPQLEQALKLARDAEYVENVPQFVSLREVHSVGIAGKDHNQIYDFMRATLVHLTATHSPNDVRIYVVGAPSAKPRWRWAGWLPHCNVTRANLGSISDQLFFEPNRIPQLWRELQRELERRQKRLGDQSQATSSSDPTLPFLLVVVDLFPVNNQSSPLGEVEAEAAVSLLLHHGKELGAAVMFLTLDRRSIPSDCRAIIEILQLQTPNSAAFRYAEIGRSAPRLAGVADLLDEKRADDFARTIAPLLVRTSSGTELPLSLAFLDMHKASTIEDVLNLNRWENSRRPTGEWLRVPIGQLGNGEVRELVFDQDQDGVHGLAAGTTGSGKSELLVTLILGLAVLYDPSVVNFVLVDYKGGTAFDIFRKLPHTIDVVTNLKGNEVVRTFIALEAEIKRREKLLTDMNKRKITEYRAADCHNTYRPFPFLFVIIDEFAEMLKEKGEEVRSRLDSVTRLGRAVGVHLILATQRPTGVVTDQMIANMKFRICLRVETPDDSRGLLRRTDAAFLPSNIPGRAYLQVGNDNLVLAQIAWAGSVYGGPKVDTSPPIEWLDRSHANALNSDTGQQHTDAVADVVISRAHQLTQQYPDRVKKQPKPWPNLLPDGGLHLNTERVDAHTLLSEAVAWPNVIDPAGALNDWLQGQLANVWTGIAWGTHAMRAAIGLLDNPTESRWHPLVLDFTRGHVVIFSASGYGKTSALRTTIVSLTATHRPDELNLYILDFGGRGLDTFSTLPHLGALIQPSEPERVQRLLRLLIDELDNRKVKLSKARKADLQDYNQSHADRVIPAILLVIDNFAEFNESFNAEIDTLTVLAREGRAFGIHLLITAERANAVPGKLFNQFSERLVLKLIDSGEYAAILERNAGALSDVPGRGYVRRERMILECQVALPVANTGNADENNPLRDSELLEQIVELMNHHWDNGPRPQTVETLHLTVPLDHVISTKDEVGPVRVRLGTRDVDLSTEILELKQKAHFIVTGSQQSGKTTLLRTWILSVAYHYSPKQMKLILVDLQQGRLSRYGGQCELEALPHLHSADVITDLAECEKMVGNLRAEMERRRAERITLPEIFVLIDNYDDLLNAINDAPKVRSPSAAAPSPDVRQSLSRLARQYGGSEGLHFVVAASMKAAKGTSDEFISFLTQQARFGIGLGTREAAEVLNVVVRGGAAELPPGRGYVVGARSGRPYLIQVATPERPETTDMESALDQWVTLIKEKWGQ
ncbi:MAG: FtsK/SpoIIIE domain-containing protein, partial [Aggregatilineales bacterium]